MVYRKQNHRFDKLSLYYRTSYRNNRLARKYRCTVRHCPYVTFKLKILQIFKKFLFKNPLTPKIFNIFRCKVNLFYIFNNLLNAGAKVSGPIPLPTDKEVITILRAVHKYKDSREQFERRTHKRLIDIVVPGAKTMESLIKIDLPAGVDIDVIQK